MDGMLIVDKPAGMSSHDVVNKVRRLFNEKSVGHLGTLDPLATGVLPLLLGRYTRLAQYFGRPDKEYTGRIRFGFATDTYDCDGEAVGEVMAVTLDAAWLAEAATAMCGVIEQTPPAYSAKKINGVPAHRLARRGEAPVLQPVAINVGEFTAEVVAPDVAAFRVTVSAGGYVRCLAHELGQELGCGAHLIELRRIRAGEFDLTHAVGLSQIAETGDAARAGLLVQSSRVLRELPIVYCDDSMLVRIRNGSQMNLPDFSDAPLVRIVSAQDGQIAAIARRLAGTLFTPQTVLG